MLFENSDDEDERPVDELIDELWEQMESFERRSDMAGDNGASELSAYYTGKSEGFELTIQAIKEMHQEETEIVRESDQEADR